MASPFGVITLSLLLVLLTASSGAGIDYFVGVGRNGWTINPAMPLRFRMNDAIVFRYDKAADAVLWVSQEHYDACNTSQPFLRFGVGDSPFVLNNPGSSYCFISADARRCRDGERLIAVILHPHNNTSSPPKSPSPSALPPTSGNAPSSLRLPPPPPKSPSPSSVPHPAPPKPASPSTTPSPPPPVPTPAQSALPPPPPPYPSSAGNASSPSPAPPVPGTKKGTGPPSTSSSAVALRAGVLACLLVGASAAIL